MGSLNTLKSLLISSKESIQAHNLLFLIMAFYPILFQSLSRGLRQDCPLSYLLYLINGEVFNLNIKTNDKIVGYSIPNQKEGLKLSQYADDTNLVVITQESVIKNFFKQFERATVATI